MAQKLVAGNPGPHARVLTRPPLPGPPHGASLPSHTASMFPGRQLLPPSSESVFLVGMSLGRQPQGFLISLWLPDPSHHAKGFISWHLIPFLIQSLFSITSLGFLLVLVRNSPGQQLESISAFESEETQLNEFYTIMNLVDHYILSSSQEMW